MNRSSDPPGWAIRLIARLTPSRHQSELLGDLQERFLEKQEGRGRLRACIWFWRQTLALTWALAVRRGQGPTLPRLPWYEFRLAFRSLRRAPALAAAGVLALGIGIGAPSTLFAIVDGFMRPLPAPDPHRIVDVSLLDESQGRRLFIPHELHLAWQESDTGLEILGAYWSDGSGVSRPGVRPLRLSGAYITPEVFSVLEARPAAGRLFQAADSLPGAPAVAIIREDVWGSRFGRGDEALGSELRINGVIHTIVGVLPADFAFPKDQQVWMPLGSQPYDYPIPIRILGRLGAGVSPKVAQEKLQSVLQSRPWQELAPGAPARAVIEEYVVQQLGRSTIRTLRIVTLLASLLVLIAAMNVAGILLARGESRSRDLAVCMAIGGSRARVAGQLMAESVLLALAGGGLGILIAFAGLAWCRSTLLAEANLSYWVRLELGASTFGFAALLSTLAAAVAGIVPSLRASQVDLAGAVKRDASRSASIRMGRLVPMVVGIETALSCALLLMSSLIVRGAIEGARSASEFPTEDVLTARLVLEDYDYPDAASRRGFASRLDESMEGSSAVKEAAFMSILPGKEASSTSLRFEDRDSLSDADSVQAQSRLVTPSFFSMFGLQLIEGRLLDSGDRPGRPLAAVVNREFVERRLQGESAVGRRFRMGRERQGPAFEIVGIVSDPGVTLDDGKREPGVFLAFAQASPEVMWVALRVSDVERRGMPALLEAVGQADAHLPVGRVRTLEQVRQRESADERLFGTLFGVFGAVAMLLAAVGLHGVISFSVSQRSREIGIRRALGATSGRVFRNTVTRGLRPAALGMACGIGLAYLLSPSLGEILYRTDPRDPAVFISVSLFLLAICGVSAMLPANRASRLDPLKVLRAD